MKRFYKSAEVGTAPGGYVVRLDGKLLKTPLQGNLIFKSQALAKAVAQEWQDQKEEIVPAEMPLMQLASTWLDKCKGGERPQMEEEVLKYAASDLLCYFADHPADLVQRQDKAWRPLLGWMKEAHGVLFATVSGIQYIQQSPESVKKVRNLLQKMDAADFTVVQAVTAVTGSVIIALALLQGGISVDEAFGAACVDELYQLEKWGEDTLARKRLDKIRLEVESASRFLGLVRESA